LAAGDVFVSVRRFGVVEAAVYHVGRIVSLAPLAGDWLTPDTDVDERGHSVIGVNGMIVRLGDALIAIDPTTLRGVDDVAPLAVAEPGPTIEQALDRLAVDPDAVTHVLITHGHPDHFSAVLAGETDKPRFPNAEHIFPAADWQHFVESPGDWPVGHLYSRIPGLLRPVEAAGLLRLVEGDLEVLPGVTLLHTAGETDGHQVVRIETPAGPLYNLGDLVHLPAEFLRTGLALPGRDPGVVREGRMRVLGDAAAGDAVVVYAHGRFPAWGTVDRLAPASFRWRYDS
jgi:glyoxylase-like metal-dependent hydrolase (beta-lactamase superfamily II)